MNVTKTYTVAAGDTAGDLTVSGVALGTSATLQDDAGNDADLSSLTATVGTSDAIVIDTTAPATPTISAITTPDDDATPTITITAEAGSTVAVYANGVELGNATESSTTAGSFSYTSSALVKKIEDKNSELVVYCSLGIRSESIASKLKKAGYSNVFNLYGGIFEWKNNGFTVYNLENIETENIHAYSKDWGIWLKKGKKVF